MKTTLLSYYYITISKIKYYISTPPHYFHGLGLMPCLTCPLFMFCCKTNFPSETKEIKLNNLSISCPALEDIHLNTVARPVQCFCGAYLLYCVAFQAQSIQLSLSAIFGQTQAVSSFVCGPTGKLQTDESDVYTCNIMKKEH